MLSNDAATSSSSSPPLATELSFSSIGCMCGSVVAKGDGIKTFYWKFGERFRPIIFYLLSFHKEVVMPKSENKRRKRFPFF